MGLTISISLYMNIILCNIHKYPTKPALPPIIHISLTLTLTLLSLFFLPGGRCWQVVHQSQQPYPSNSHRIVASANSTINATVTKASELDLLLYIYKQGTNIYSESQRLASQQTSISILQQQLTYDAPTSGTYCIVIVPVIRIPAPYRISIRVNGIQFHAGDYYLSARYDQQIVGSFVVPSGGMCNYMFQLQLADADTIYSIQLIHGALSVAPSAIRVPHATSLKFTQLLHWPGTWYIVITYAPLTSATAVRYISLSISADDLYTFYGYQSGTGAACIINCLAVANAYHLQPYTGLCDCMNGYTWDDQRKLCRVDCRAISHAMGYVENSTQLCICDQSFEYSYFQRVCRIKCSTIANTNTTNNKSTVLQNKYDTCQCRQPYQWNPKSYQCQRTLEFVSSVTYSVVVGFITVLAISIMYIGYLALTMLRIKTKIQSHKIVGIQALQIHESSSIMVSNTNQQVCQIGNSEAQLIDDGKKKQEHFYVQTQEKLQDLAKIKSDALNSNQYQQINTGHQQHHNLNSFAHPIHYQSKNMHEHEDEKSNAQTPSNKIEKDKKQKIEQPQKQEDEQISFNKVTFSKIDPPGQNKENEKKQIVQSNLHFQINHLKRSNDNINEKAKDQQYSISYESQD